MLIVVMYNTLRELRTMGKKKKNPILIRFEGLAFNCPIFNLQLKNLEIIPYIVVYELTTHLVDLQTEEIYKL